MLEEELLFEPFTNGYLNLSRKELVSELRKGHSEFLNKIIPEIEQYFMILPTKIDKMNHRILNVCFKRFNDFRNELTKHIHFEEVYVFPYLMEVSIDCSIKKVVDFVKNHENHEEQLKEVIQEINQKLMQLNYLMSYRILLIKLTYLLEKLEIHGEMEETLFTFNSNWQLSIRNVS